jgi:hypothetical protein
LPAHGQDQFPETISPDLCTVTPLTDAELVAIVEQAPEAESVDGAGISLEDGEPADDATIDTVNELVRTSVACTNANDPLRSFALFTDRYLQQRFGGDNQDDLGHLLAALTRTPDVTQENDRLTLDGIDNVLLLPDGRVAATVTTSNLNTEFVDVLLLASVDAQWKIDAVQLGEPQPRATPAA